MMSVKKMVDLYLKYNLDEETWKMLYNMTCHDLISRDNWTAFYKKCADWTMSEDGNSVIDGEGNILYIYDDNGYLVKA